MIEKWGNDSDVRVIFRKLYKKDGRHRGPRKERKEKEDDRKKRCAGLKNGDVLAAKATESSRTCAKAACDTDVRENNGCLTLPPTRYESTLLVPLLVLLLLACCYYFLSCVLLLVLVLPRHPHYWVKGFLLFPRLIHVVWRTAAAAAVLLLLFITL